MAEYANHHFNAYIPDKDTVNGKARSFESPASKTYFKNSHDIWPPNGKISGKNSGMSTISRLWKGLEDIRKWPSDEVVEVPVEKFVTLAEQVILLLRQASLSVSYTSLLNILKIITKDPRKAKAMLKQNDNMLRESEYLG